MKALSNLHKPWVQLRYKSFLSLFYLKHAVPPVVNILALNMALDRLAPASK